MEKIVKTYMPYQYGYEWDFHNIYNIFIRIDKREINSKYWAIARNNCGESFSDTVTVKNDLNVYYKRDPWNQRPIACPNDTTVFQLELRKLEKIDLLIYGWYLFKRSGKFPQFDIDEIEWTQPYSLKIKTPKIIFEGHYQIYAKTFDYKNKSKMSYPAPIFTLIPKTWPVITAQPKNKTVVIDKNETIFLVGVEYNMYEPTFGSLYFMPYFGAKPQEILKMQVSEMGDFKYIKNVTLSDEGYYYAVLTNDGFCGISITDTVKVNVIPSGSITNVDYGSGNKKDFFIYPNPATDYIEIDFERCATLGKCGTSEDIRIFDMLGEIVLTFEQTSPSVQRLDISILHTGTYFIKIGNKIEKFVKI